jgi:filamentous hemagglutinin family protein
MDMPGTVRKKSGHKTCRYLLATSAALGAFLSSFQAQANPAGGNVTAGSATIETQGNTLNVHQSSDRAVIDWRSFDIGVDEETRFYQPSSNSFVLNRVNSATSSQIYGKLTANGGVMILNQNGVVFGKDAQVDVGSLAVTTSAISDEAFMAGNHTFTPGSNPDAKIVNEGTISVRDAGLVGLVAPQVENKGVINARMGKVALASGDAFTMDMYGDNLIRVSVSDDVAQQVVRHSGAINAEGGIVQMTAAAARDVVNSLIDVSGDVNATRIDNTGGRILIQAEGSNGTGRSGNSTVLVSGKLNATGNIEGGKIEVFGDHVALKNGAEVNASGQIKGGTVHIGGEYLGGGSTQRAKATVIQSGASVKANGKDGEVIVWSDNYTNFAGKIEANGEGSFVETSSKDILTATGRVYAEGGEWLLDPGDISVQNDGGGPDDTNTLDTDGPFFEAPSGTNSIVTTQAIVSALGGADVTVMTGNTGGGNGDITIYDDIGYTGGTDRSLTFKAYRNIFMDGATISSSNAALNVTMNSRYDGTSTEGRFRAFSNSSIITHGGNVTIGGGPGASGYAMGIAGASGAVFIGGGIFAQGGNIAIKGGIANGADTYGIHILLNANIQTTGNGTITLDAQGGTDTNGMRAMRIGDNSIISTVNGDIGITGVGGTSTAGDDANGVYIDNSSVTTTNGGITISGTGGSATGNNAQGVLISNGSTVQSTGATGAANRIQINGIAGTGNNNVHGVELSGGSIVISDHADIEINGSTTDNNSFGIYFDNGDVFSTGAASGHINLTAAATTSTDFYTLGGLLLIGGSSSLKDIIINADEIDLSAASLDTLGNVVLKPRTSTQTIGIGGGAGDFNLSDTELGYITNNVSKLIIGSATSGVGDVDIDSWDLSSKTYDVEVYGGDIDLGGLTLGTGDFLAHAQDAVADAGDLTISANITRAVNGDMLLDLRADQNILNSGGADIIATDANSDADADPTTSPDRLNIILNANRDNNADGGSIALTNATITTLGGDFIAGGGLTPATVATKASTLDHGVLLDGTEINAASGTITLRGTGSDSLGFERYGILLKNSSLLEVSSGAINLEGTGGSGLGFASGVRIDDAHILSTGTGGGVGDIRITGTGTSSTTTNVGVQTQNFTNTILTRDADVYITGTGGSTGNNSFGVEINSAIHTNSTVAGKGNITISGFATANSASPSYGIYSQGMSVYTQGVGGDINITASSDYADDFAARGFANDIGTAGTLGDITINADEIDILNSWIRTNGSIYLLPNTSSTSIGLGGGAGTLNLSDLELAYFDSQDKFIIGDSAAGTGLVTIDTWNYSGRPYDLEIYGGDIAVNDLMPGIGTNALTLNARTGDITITQDNLVLNAGSSITAFDDIIVKAATTNRNINIGGGAGGLDISDTDLSYLDAGDKLVFGDSAAGTGHVTFDTVDLTANHDDLEAYGGAITVTGSLDVDGTILLKGSGATNDVTLNGTISSSTAGDAVTIVSGNDFTNGVGAGLFNLTGGGRWLLYTEDPLQNTLNGLAFGFERYSCSYGSCAGIPAGQNGLLYSSADPNAVSGGGGTSQNINPLLPDHYLYTTSNLPKLISGAGAQEMKAVSSLAGTSGNVNPVFQYASPMVEFSPSLLADFVLSDIYGQSSDTGGQDKQDDL